MRPSKFDTNSILDGCLRLVNDEGSKALSVSAVARSLGAPSGSIYHRFPSRDVLVASLWLRCIERFQAGFVAALNKPDPIEAAEAAARHTITWSRDNLEEARLLLLHRSSDLLANGWPDEIADLNEAQMARASQAMADLTSRLGGLVDQSARVRFAVVDIPMGAVRPALVSAKPPSKETERLAMEAVQAILEPLSPKERSIQ